MESHQKSGLAGNVLNLFDSIVMAIAGTAPAYSVAATAAVLFGAVGVLSPGALLWSGIPMFGVVMAFLYLNRWQPNAGASYAWVGKALQGDLGFLAGWALIVSATLFMVAGSFPAGSVTLALFSPTLSQNLVAVTIVGGLWFIVISTLVMLGIRITANAQWIMSSIELLILVVSGVVAIVKFGVHGVNAFQWSWFSPFAFSSLPVFMSGALIATFYYWGWDVAANLNEESKESRRIPGIAVAIGIVILFLIFELFTTAIQVGMTPKEISAASSNLLQALGTKLYGPHWGNVMVLAVALSTIATLETSLLQVTRTLFAMGRDGVLPRGFSRIHDQWRTPYFASIVVLVVGLVLFILSNFLPSVSAVMTDAINAISLQVVVYYALAAIAVMVYYRRVLFRTAGNFLFLFLWPLIAAVFLTVVGVFDVPNLGPVVDSVGIGLLAVGLIPMLWGHLGTRNPFYFGRREAFDPAAPGGPETASTD